jgi:hypothetical protein
VVRGIADGAAIFTYVTVQSQAFSLDPVAHCRFRSGKFHFHDWLSMQLYEN